jgi:glycosyltransferase involved in cell wall biosynthesis
MNSDRGQGRHYGEGDGPLVSVVVPTYNRAHLLPEALDACLNQTYTNLEIIVVNDGSKDATDALLTSYAARDKRLRFISKENEGIPDTVNRGFREARGEYLTWTSDDNYYYPHAIEAMVEYLDAHPDVAMVYSDCRFIDAAGADLGIVEAEEPESLEYHCAAAGCLLFRRSVLDTVDPFRRQWTRCHDFDFYHRIYAHFRVARLPQVLYAYRVHEASMSGNYEAIATEYYRLVSTWITDPKRLKGIRANVYSNIARNFETHDRPWAAIRYRLRAAIAEPHRAFAAWDALWKTTYRSMPTPIRSAWHSLKTAVK